MSGLVMIHMKRTNLVLDERLLEEATRLAGAKTYSRAVDMALRDFVRRVKARRILELAGSGLWEGDLSAIRGDRPPNQSRGPVRDIGPRHGSGWPVARSGVRRRSATDPRRAVR